MTRVNILAAQMQETAIYAQRRGIRYYCRVSSSILIMTPVPLLHMAVLEIDMRINTKRYANIGVSHKVL